MRFPYNHHATLPQRKALIARLLFLRAADRAGAPAHAGEEETMKHLREVLLTRANRDLQLDPSLPLDKFVQALARYARREMTDERADLVDGSYAARLVEAIEVEASAYNCSRCTMSPARLCRGVLDDDAIVHDHGACIRPFKDFFDDALACAKSSYRRYCPLFPPDADLPRIELATCHDPECGPVFARGDFFVYGLTRSLHPEPTVAMLAFRTAGFGWDCFQASAYVLFHECIAHGFQDIVPAGARPNPDKFDAFAEGWMDWVALSILHDRLAGRLPDGTILGEPRLPFETGEAANDYHRQRARWNTNDAPGTAATADTGRRGATYVSRILAGELGPTDGFEAFMRLSLGLNVEAGLARERDSIAREAYDASRQRGSRADRELRGRLGEFIETRDPRAVLP